ncbi:MAG: ABC transporter ATP-binding protein [Desulfuromonas sp.]|uniref:DUF302 domain-containing protein n=1 Tax=Desulfuromonas sp. TaxID=892 RepID=UPI000CB541F8|nr:DUF302 domain-containing protein [Desulfuromonas sp.]PLX83327.1 MAG: ABC transporter ATP-binding protein [Desulfuromonas sp.]
MEEGSSYYFGKRLEWSFGDALPRVREALAKEGFGILTEIDVRAKLGEKLGVDFRPYVILGACNPKMAYRALGLEINIGVLLPCNVIVFVDEDGGTVVRAMDPVWAMKVVDNPEVEEVAAEVRKLLGRALESL